MFLYTSPEKGRKICGQLASESEFLGPYFEEPVVICFVYSTGLYFFLSISSVGCFHPATTRRDSVHIKPASIFYDDSNAFELMDLFSAGQMF